jgi:excinuclease ABC subunit C
MKEKEKNRLQNIISALPDSPGVYQYIDAEGKVIYVGKAKNLKKRVTSYFQRDAALSGKTSVMVKKINDIQTITVETEIDALLLENNLIKKYQPRYNILLKDDKTFPWICIKNEPFPRVFSTRNRIKDGSEYFGPYASVSVLRALLEVIKEIYPLRTCHLDLREEKIQKNNYRECLDYHVGTCKAPCTLKQSETEYLNNIKEIRNILKGNIHSNIRDIKNKMKEYADALEFEKAIPLKEKLILLENFQSKSTIVNPNISDVDVFTMINENDLAFVNFLKVMNGSIIQSHTLEIRKKLDEGDEEILIYAINELRQRFQSQSEELLVPFEPQFVFPNCKYTVPKIGDKKALLDLSLRNVENYRREKNRQIELSDPERHTDRILLQMKNDLRLSELPKRIECFDNSNIQGAFAVSAMTVFINAKPAKKEYRHFNIKTVEGPDDFASMEEVIYRRYQRVTEEGLDLPQLIVVDGGKGQLSAAIASLKKLNLFGKIAIVGIAKRLEEIYYPDDPLPLYLNKKSETLRVLQFIRDEAHRFGITHHRSKRSRETFKSELENIKGISGKTVMKLLREFKSVQRIKESRLEELVACVGQHKAQLVKKYFYTEENNRNT